MAKLALFVVICFMAFAGCYALSPTDMMSKAAVEAASKFLGTEVMNTMNKIVKLMEEIAVIIADAVKDRDIQKAIGDMTKAAAEAQAIAQDVLQQLMSKVMG